MSCKMSVAEGKVFDGRTCRSHNDEICCVVYEGTNAEATKETKHQHEHKLLLMWWAVILADDRTSCCRKIVTKTPSAQVSPKTHNKWMQYELEMWANVQRDGRPAKYRWCPLFNAAKFGWRPLPECRAVTLYQDAKTVEISLGSPNSPTDLSR